MPVRMPNGLMHPKMKVSKVLFIGLLFGLFQMGMPLIGYLVGSVFEEFISHFTPWIALILLGFIGGKMLFDGFKKDEEEKESVLDLKELLIEGVATSIDALSVGFTISDYDLTKALLCAAIIAVLTFVICFAGVMIGKKAGTKLAGKAGIFGGSILIFIGLEIFVKGVFLS